VCVCVYVSAMAAALPKNGVHDPGMTSAVSSSIRERLEAFVSQAVYPGAFSRAGCGKEFGSSGEEGDSICRFKDSEVLNSFDGHFLNYWLYWLAVCFFVVLQLLCFAGLGDSFFGVVTGGVVQSLSLSTGVAMTWHMCCGSVMWFLGFVQVFCGELRKGRLAWIHRASGRLLLVLWFIVVGPTAAYLSLYVGIGRARAQIIMTAFAITGVDTTLFASYYFWRGLLVARRQIRGKESFGLHGRAMRTGLLFTMLILFQRPLQFWVILFRYLILTAVSFAPSSPWELPASLAWLRGLAIMASDHNVILSLTTVFPAGLMLLLIDGPRSKIGHAIVGLKEGEEEEMFGSQLPSTIELTAWRLRVPVYLFARMLVTSGWTQDPVHLG